MAYMGYILPAQRHVALFESHSASFLAISSIPQPKKRHNGQSWTHAFTGNTKHERGDVMGKGRLRSSSPLFVGEGLEHLIWLVGV